ncbi:uncharacterized protein LOC141853249 [Brevipalpus obovatus]|uniref:uncharacterized protein LOC141853249 n=1 Tax=Brevipalpus obovatus TaxID=246614 RepID=UPI003D9F559B
MSSSHMTEAVEAFNSSLNDLTFNSKPIISMLTMLAEDYKDLVPLDIVRSIEKRLRTIGEGKQLPLLYLIDSICKNVKSAGRTYIDLFTQNIVSNFCQVFEKSNETTRASLFKLRRTWTGLFPSDKLYAIDQKCHKLDRAWPIEPVEPMEKPNKSSNVSITNSPTETNITTTTNTTTTSSPKNFATGGVKKANRVDDFGVLTMDYGLKRQKVLMETMAKQDRLKAASKRKEAQANQQSIQSTKRLRGGPKPSEVRLPSVLPHQHQQSTKDRDYRKEFDYLFKAVDNSLVKGQLSQQQHSNLVQEMHRAMQNDHPGITGQGLSDVEQLCTIVDGKSRSLYYLDDKTAIVLMKAPSNAPLSELIKANPNDLEPKQIRFEGKPTKVFIDSDRGSDEFILLEFNDQPKTFFHNEHEQRIKFGGPCREIILNGRPYRANFAGPPIKVWFNGDTQTHTLRLDGLTPRVELSKDIRTDLWTEFIRKITSRSPSNTETLFDAFSSINQSLSGPHLSQIFPPAIGPSSQPTHPSLSLIHSSTKTPGLPDPNLPIPPSAIPVQNEALSMFSSTLNSQQPSISIPLLNSHLNQFKPSVPTASDSNSSVPDPRSKPNIADLYHKLVAYGVIKENGIFASSLPPPTDPAPIVSNSFETVSGVPPSRTSVNAAPNPVIPPTLHSNSGESSSDLHPSTVLPVTSPSGNNDGPSEQTVGSSITVAKSPIATDQSPLDLEPETLKIFHPSISADLYNGSQCANCSLRFGCELKEQSAYKEHLDWHFRRNQNEKSSTSKPGPTARHDWPHPLETWVTFRDMQDLIDQGNPTITDDVEMDADGQDASRDDEIPTVRADEDEEKNKCPVCGEKFEPVWVEEAEEWRLKKAMRSEDDRIYHPLCYDDHVKQRSVLRKSKESDIEASDELGESKGIDLENGENHRHLQDDASSTSSSEVKSAFELLGFKDSPITQSGIEDSSVCCIM